MVLFYVFRLLGAFPWHLRKFKALLVLNMIDSDSIFIFVFVSALLWFCISSKSFKFGNTVKTEYLNRIPNTDSWIPKWSECTSLHFFFLTFYRKCLPYFARPLWLLWYLSVVLFVRARRRKKTFLFFVLFFVAISSWMLFMKYVTFLILFNGKFLSFCCASNRIYRYHPNDYSDTSSQAKLLALGYFLVFPFIQMHRLTNPSQYVNKLFKGLLMAIASKWQNLSKMTAKSLFTFPSKQIIYNIARSRS